MMMTEILREQGEPQILVTKLPALWCPAVVTDLVSEGVMMKADSGVTTQSLQKRNLVEYDMEILNLMMIRAPEVNLMVHIMTMQLILFRVPCIVNEVISIWMARMG